MSRNTILFLSYILSLGLNIVFYLCITFLMWLINLIIQSDINVWIVSAIVFVIWMTHRTARNVSISVVNDLERKHDS